MNNSFISQVSGSENRTPRITRIRNPQVVPETPLNAPPTAMSALRPSVGSRRVNQNTNNNNNNIIPSQFSTATFNSPAKSISKTNNSKSPSKSQSNSKNSKLSTKTKIKKRTAKQKK